MEARHPATGRAFRRRRQRRWQWRCTSAHSFGQGEAHPARSIAAARPALAELEWLPAAVWPRPGAVARVLPVAGPRRLGLSPLLVPTAGRLFRDEVSDPN